MGVCVVLYIQAFKMTTLQELHTARNKLPMLLAIEPLLQRGLKHCFGPFGGKKMEEGIEKELRMQKLQWKLYHLLAFYCHQEQNIGKQLILFSDVLINNSLTKCKGPEHLTESCLRVALITCSLVRSNQPVDPSCINQVVNRTQIPLHLLKSLLDFSFTGYITAKCQMPCCIEIYTTSK